MSNHTPGPWTDDGNGNIFGTVPNVGVMLIANTGGMSRSEFRKQAKANARLIAAAPEMYALLKMYSEHPVEGPAFDNMVDSLLGRIEGNE